MGGKFLSNTWKLVSERGYSAVMIEGDRRRFDELQRNHAGRPEVVVIHRFVGWEGNDALDALLAGTPAPRDFDVLSIVMDGNEASPAAAAASAPAPPRRVHGRVTWRLFRLYRALRRRRP